jgi:hypothetical protein
MRNLILIPIALLAFSGTQPPVGCRVGERTVDWSEARTLPEYTDTDPLFTLKIDLCCAVNALTGFENQSNLSPAVYSTSPRQVTIQASFDPSFARRFIVGTANVTVPGIAGAVPVSDLVLDYGGVSGVTVPHSEQALVITNLVVPINPFTLLPMDDFFRQPWTLYLRAVCSQPSGSASNGNGSFQYVTLASAGASVTYNP